MLSLPRLSIRLHPSQRVPSNRIEPADVVAVAVAVAVAAKRVKTVSSL
jgi:hypothetical protein